MTDGAIDAPGEAPSRPAMDPSAPVTISVPRVRTPILRGCGLISWARWPASINDHSLSWAAGWNRRSCWSFRPRVARSCPTR